MPNKRNEHISNLVQGLIDNPTPTHNPVIGSQHIDTLNNIHQSLTSLRDLCLVSREHEHSFTGYYHFISAIVDALEFETAYRLNQDRN